MPDGNVFSEFLDDYFAECDEHLAVMRRAVISLTGRAGRVVDDPEPLEELRRRLHTVKGLSGMVRFREAEEIAHVLEDCVKAYLRREAPLAEESVGLLREGITRLDAALNARRNGTAVADPRSFVEETIRRCRDLEAVDGAVQEESDAQVRMRRWSPAERKRLLERQKAGERLWCFSFTPSPERNARGMDVNAVRERLGALGTILKAVPQVSPDAGITFDFYVTTAAEPSTWAGWAEDGFSWEACPENGQLFGFSDEDETGSSVPPEDRREATLRTAVRVDVHRLDELYRSVGALFTLTHRLQDQLQEALPRLDTASARALGDVVQELTRELRGLRDRITALRMMPVGDIFDRLQLAALNLASELGRKIRVNIEGARTEIDKFVAERILDPLLHVVRNAVSHGIEPPEERMAAGKDPVGMVRLVGRSSGDWIEMFIEDDGRGSTKRAVRRASFGRGRVGSRAPGRTFPTGSWTSCAGRDSAPGRKRIGPAGAAWG